jgi:hypothetical protein
MFCDLDSITSRPMVTVLPPWPSVTQLDYLVEPPGRFMCAARILIELTSQNMS